MKLGVHKQPGSHNGRWKKKQEVFILKHYKKDLSAKEISEELGKTKFAIINKYREISGLRDKKVITNISKNG